MRPTVLRRRGIGVLVVYRVSAESVFWCMAFGALIAVALPCFRCSRDSVGISTSAEVPCRELGPLGCRRIIRHLGYAQSYIYFAALHGGLDGAAEIARAGCWQPLALMWRLFERLAANASRLLADGRG